jgi:radical SAM protein with 4Fe4S-binding SPASM domain
VIPIPFNPDDVPYIAEDLVYEQKEGDMHLVLAPELPNCVSVNDMGKNIITTCDNQKTIREITEIISKKEGEPFDEALPKIVAFFNYLEDKKFAYPEGIPEPAEKKIPESLMELWLNITYKCNLRCKHCHSSFGTPLENELTLEEIKNIIKEASVYNECKLFISGGEPFCRTDILDILKIASDYFPDKVMLITNGTLITEKHADELAQLPIRIQVSLEGPDPESNDCIRGTGVFTKAVKTIRMLKERGIPPVVRMTLLKTNIHKIEEMIQFVEKEGLDFVSLGTLQRSGRAYEAVKDIDPSTDELIAVYREIRVLDPDLSLIHFAEGLTPAVSRLEKYDLCGAGSAMLSVGADGGVYPCAGLMYDEFLAGNIRDEPLEEIWKNSPVLKEFRELSIEQIPGCNKCPIRFLCGGGCLVDIYWEHGNLYGKTPRCSLLHAMKWDELKRTAYTKKKME